MLEVLINNPSDRKGEGKIDTSNAYNGSFCFIKGVDASGYTLLDLPSDSTEAIRSLYPINKYRYEEDLSDTSDAVDKRTKGEQIVYFTGEGEYITSKWVPATFGFTSAVWNAVQGGRASSAFAGNITSPGTATVLATLGNAYMKCYVATGDARANSQAGYLIGTSAGTFNAGSTWAKNGYVARVRAFYAQDSANPLLHIRLTPRRFDDVVV